MNNIPARHARHAEYATTTHGVRYIRNVVQYREQRYALLYAIGEPGGVQGLMRVFDAIYRVDVDCSRDTDVAIRRCEKTLDSAPDVL